MAAIDRLAYTNGWSRRHPLDKLVLAGGFVIASVALPSPLGPGFVLAAALAAMAAARLDLWEIARLMAVPAGFIVSGAVVLALALRLDQHGVSVEVSADGVTAAVRVSLRALAATASLLLLVTTTPITDLLALLRKARLPVPIVDVVMLVYRFIMLVAVIAERTRLSQSSRLGYAGLARGVRSAGLLAASLLPRSLERAQRLQLGLDARAYQGDLRVLPHACPVSRLFIAGALALQASIAVTSLVLASGVGIP